MVASWMSPRHGPLEFRRARVYKSSACFRSARGRAQNGAISPTMRRAGSTGQQNRVSGQIYKDKTNAGRRSTGQ